MKKFRTYRSCYDPELIVEYLGENTENPDCFFGVIVRGISSNKKAGDLSSVFLKDAFIEEPEPVELKGVDHKPIVVSVTIGKSRKAVWVVFLVKDFSRIIDNRLYLNGGDQYNITSEQVELVIEQLKSL